jgi:hypothetical protein
VYSNDPHTLNEFKHNICEIFTSVKVTKLKLVLNNLFGTLEKFILEQTGNILSIYCDGQFLKLSVAEAHSMECWPRCGALSCHSITLSHEEHAVLLFSGHRKIIVKVAISHFFLCTNLK